MTSPPEEISVKCPGCGKLYQDWRRPSINRSLGEKFDDKYLDEATSSTCPDCGLKVHHDALIVGEDGAWEIGGLSASELQREQEHWDSKSQPLPAELVEVSFHRSFDGAEVAKLKQGLIPQAMEDKWFIILRDDSLDFYRSWTGLHIYRLAVRPAASGLVAGPLFVNNDPEQYERSDDEEDKELVNFLIELVLERG